MPSSVGIVIPRRLFGVARGMHAGIELMHGGIGWAVLGLPLLTLFLDAFARFTIAEGWLNRTELGN